MTPENSAICNEKLLDDTLRYLYSTLSSSGGLLLAIRFSYHGRRYEADTAEEAKKLVELLEEADKERAKKDPEFARKLLLKKAGWTDERFWNLVNNIGETQVMLLEAIFGSGEYPVFAPDLAKTLGLKSQVALAGVLSGFSKQAKRLGVRVADVYQVTTYWKGRKKERVFNVSEGFREAAKQNQWPFVPLLKERRSDASSTNETRK
jgi:hypothetical protein